MDYKYNRNSACLVHRDTILAMVKTDASVGAIARAVKTNRRHIHTFLKREGVKKVFPQWRSGSGNGNWRGGRRDDKGYVLIYKPDHPHARAGCVPEHRLVMEEKLGRILDRKEVVHHKDRNKKNNHPDNLELFENNTKHLKHELVGKVPKWTKAGKRRMLQGRRRYWRLWHEQNHGKTKTDAARLRILRNRRRMKLLKAGFVPYEMGPRPGVVRKVFGRLEQSRVRKAP